MPADELQPLSVGEILSTAVRIYWSRFGTLFRLVALFILPFEVLYALITGSSSSNRGGVASLFSGLLLVLTGQLASAACLKAVSDTYLGHPTSWRASLDFVWHRVGVVVAVALLDVVIVGIGFIFLVIPGLYFDIALLLATPALLIEGLAPVAALRRSRTLVRGMWWRTFGCYLLAAIFVGIVSLIPTLLFLHATGASGQNRLSHPLASQFASVFASLFTTPFMAAVVVLVYYDLRVRKEGFGRSDLAEAVHVDPGQLPPGRFGYSEEPPYPE